MAYGMQVVLWIAGFAGVGLGARYLFNRGEH